MSFLCLTAIEPNPGTYRRYIASALIIGCLVNVMVACTSFNNDRKSATETPFADVHLHFNWDQQELLSPEEAISRLKQNNVVLAAVSSVPTDYALKLASAGKGWIIPLFSPYITVAHRRSWYRDPEILKQARQGLDTGLYRGIGELHLWDGLKPKRDNPVLLGLLEMSVQFDVPFLIHTESANYRFFAQLCQQHPQVRFLWAHAGGRIEADSVAILMSLCPNVWIELSVRDPWRYNTLVGKEQELLPDWLQLITRFPNRVMTGSDPVWNVTRTQSWDEADAGWDHINQLIQFHRHWLKQLPPALEKKVRLTNALQFFHVTQQ